MACWWRLASSCVLNQTPAIRCPESHSSFWGWSPMTAPHCAPTKSSMVIPTVQPSWRACATIWSVVCFTFGRRILGIASISAAVSKSFMPIGMLRSRRYWLSPPMIASQSYVSVVTLVSLRSASLPYPRRGYHSARSLPRVQELPPRHAVAAQEVAEHHGGGQEIAREDGPPCDGLEQPLGERLDHDEGEH